MTEQTQTLFFPADQFLRLLSIFSVLQQNSKDQQMRSVFLDLSESVYCVLGCFCTCEDSMPSRPSLSMHSSFSRFLMSGLAALMSILRLEVGVQGSTEPTSIPFLGVVRGPMVGWFSSGYTR